METTNMPSPARVAALEKVPHAARRLALSVSGVYRLVAAGQLRLVKTGVRGSAIPSEDVDAVIAARIAEASKKGGAQ